MSWSWINPFRSQDVFERKPENVLMLEQFLAELEARHARISATTRPEDRALLDEAGKVVDAYRAHRAARTGTRPPLPDWNQAFMAEDLLAGLLPPAEAKADLSIRLAELKKTDPAAWNELSALWGMARERGTEDAEASAILVSALRATHWRNTQSWIIRTLGTIYAVRLRNAFFIALCLGGALVAFDTLYSPSMTAAALTGLGFAIAAGLLGASFSAMIGRHRVFKLDNIEEARAVTSAPMLVLRLGVGVAAAMILYFFFEAGLVDGVLFPDLAQIGFGRVSPLPSENAELRAAAQALQQSADALTEKMDLARSMISNQLVLLPQEAALAQKEALIAEAATPAALTSVAGSPDHNGAAAMLGERLQVINGHVSDLNGDLRSLTQAWSSLDLALGKLAPNADLSKLVVWSFAAGFMQTLVPSLLARVTPRSEDDPAAG